MTEPRNLPTGTVTFLFSDIEGSTRLLRDLGDRYAEIVGGQRQLLLALIRAGGGEEVDSQGDGLFAAFGSAKNAVAAAVASQRAIAARTWPDGVIVRLRMGLHTGEPLRTETGYVGIDVHRAARICASGHGGQILVSQATRELVERELTEGVALRDLGSHSLKDLAEPEHLFQLVIPDLRGEFPPLRSLDTLPNNLPRQLTSFIGRARELGEIKRHLAATSLLTLTGVGGCGKTRLALQLAADLLETFRDGVWFVELAALTDPSQVTQVVASALGIRESQRRPLLETLTDHLATKHLLLCLDNCEHLIAPCAALVETLLRTCPGLRILATSREALGIGGEQIFPVPSLANSEAARLFVERASFVRPGFTLTPENAEAVAQVCHRLDGIPLALELAAARMRALSVTELAARLDDRFRLLTGGSRTALPRHRTLLAAIDWSYGLLSEEERNLLRRTSVFAGVFTLAAAETIGSHEGIGPDEVLNLLGHLVEKSLLVATDQDGETRYRLLETVRQFAGEKLLEAGDGAEVRSRHLDWYLHFAEQAEPELTSQDQLQWIARLEREHDNLRAALEWSLSLSQPEAALRLASALNLFWFLHGHWSEGLQWLEKALALPGEAAAPILAKANLASGHPLGALGGDPERSQRRIRCALEIYEGLGDKHGMAEALFALGLVAPENGVSERARVLFEASLELKREIGDQVGVARVLANLGVLERGRGQWERAKAYLEESLGVARKTGDRWVLTLALAILSETARDTGDYDRAEERSTECLRLALDLGHKMHIGSSLVGFAEIAGARGQPERVPRLLGAFERLGEVLGGRSTPLRRQAEHSASSARAALGQGAFESAWAEGRAMSLEHAVEYALQRDG